ncbi:hypothetical protein KHP62_01915 [Rhodobacteraceae bacterium NNCM2]|nr:hypothetical protein [Coraliihabitans acroporae]
MLLLMWARNFGKAALVAGIALSGPAVAEELDPEKLIHEQFLRFDPDYDAPLKYYGERLEEMAASIASAEANGRNVPCSQQLYLEAKWLHGYTASWDRLNDKLERIEASLAIQDQDFAEVQSPVDGFWGACHEEHFMRLAATLEGLARLEERGAEPRFKIRPLGRFDSGKKLIDRLQSLLISDIAQTGIDHRSELGSLMTTFALGSLKPHLRELLIESLDLRSPDVLDSVAEAFRFFLAGAQDPKTGYWGAWYIDDGKIIKTADLSFTYHIIAYAKRQVAHWPEIIDTTQKIEHLPYPYGWKHDGQDNNHNLYDVAKILAFGWQHMLDDEKLKIAGKIAEMVDWSVENTLNDDGSFKFDPSFSNSLGAEYYFGVSFLDIVGYWDTEKRFWTDEAFDGEAMELCHKISASLDNVGVSGWQAQGARQKLERSCDQSAGQVTD